MRTLFAALTLAAGVAVSLAATQPPQDGPPKARTGPAFSETPFGKTANGTAITQYTLTNRNGAILKCITYGTIITELHVPDKNGQLADVVLGFDNLPDYLVGHPYFGATAGRCANRIAQGKFKLDGKDYTLATNNGKNHLHGGKEGFDKKVWTGDPFIGTAGPGVKFTYRSKDGEEGYPGNLSVSMSYTLTDRDEVVIEYRAATDKPTVCNLAHHSYFNLAGQAHGDILGHDVQIFARNYTPSNESLTPTGKIAPVAGTPFDFTKPKPIGKDLKAAGGDPVGFDLNYVLDKGQTDRAELAARVTEPKSGRVLEVLTTEPGLQFYTGNFLDGALVGKDKAAYKQYTGLCLEPQKFPDSVNHPEWKDKSNAVLRPGETYRQTTVYKFSVAK